jgi:hypothetical protein
MPGRPEREHVGLVQTEQQLLELVEPEDLADPVVLVAAEAAGHDDVAHTLVAQGLVMARLMAERFGA